MTIPYGRQTITDDDIVSVTDVLKSDFLTQGPCVPRFERAIAEYCGSRKGVATNSATSALHLACLALGVREGDIVWTSAITFVASANCAIYCGATIDFVDIDPETCNISIAALEEKLEIAAKEGRLPKVVIPVHLGGLPCDMKAIRCLAERYGFKIIEDAAHAIGAEYGAAKVGNCEFSEVTVFSFHPVKIITTGEGGMAVTNDPKLAAAMERLRSHGITRDASEMTHTSDGPWFYQQLELGFNYRMTELQAALGISQLTQIDKFLAARRELARNYDALLSPDLFLWQKRAQDINSSFHLYIIQINAEQLKASHREVFERLRSRGIMANLHYIPAYRHPYFRSNGHQETHLKGAELYYSRAISLPLYPGLSIDQQENIANALITPVGHQTIF